MYSISDAQVLQYVTQLGWPFCRISALLLAMPIIGTQMVSARVRLMLGLALTVLVFPLIPEVPKVEFFSVPFFLILMHQIIIGVFMGILVHLFFEVFAMAGHIISLQNGLSSAMLIDPVTAQSVPVIAQWYSMLATLLYIVLDGHLVLIKIVILSFNTFPIGVHGISFENYYKLANEGAWLFSAALIMCLPSVVALLVINLAFSVITRVAPQFNVFSVGFPFILIISLVIFWFSMQSFLPSFEAYSEYQFQWFTGLLKL